MRFLSDEWLAALDEVGRTATVADGTSIVIEQRVECDGEAVVWHLDIADGIRVRPGSTAAADVTLSCDEATARAIAAGVVSAQRAFLNGRLQLGGDVGALISARGALQALGSLYEAVRDRVDDLVDPAT